MLIHRSWFEKSRLLAIIDIINYDKYVCPSHFAFWYNTVPCSYEAGFKQRAVLQDGFLKLERQKGKASRFW